MYVYYSSKQLFLVKIFITNLEGFGELISLRMHSFFFFTIVRINKFIVNMISIDKNAGICIRSPDKEYQTIF